MMQMPSPSSYSEETIKADFECYFGDVKLLSIFDEIGEDKYITEICKEGKVDDLKINSTLFYEKQPVMGFSHRYAYEFVLIHWRGNIGIASVRHPVTKVETFFQVEDPKWHEFLASVKKGQTIDWKDLDKFDEKEKMFLVAARIVVPSDYEKQEKNKWEPQIKRMSTEIVNDGLTLIQDIYDPILLASIAKYNRAVFEYFGGMNPPKYSKWRTWNDDPIGRYYNYMYTEFITQVSKRDMVNASLTLNIYVREGKGFAPHYDSSPPFDLTLDIVTDHEGPGSRPIFLAKNNGKFVPEIIRLDLKLGQSALFIGSQVYHYGGPLDKGSYHNVTLFTWEYVSD